MMQQQMYMDFRKRRNTAETSKEAFKEIKKEGLLVKQHVIAYQAIEKHQPVTRRMLSKLTGLDITALCRVLDDAVKTEDPIIKICFEGPCPLTGKRVQWFSTVEYKVPEVK